MVVVTTAYSWCNGHSTSITACGVWWARVRVQVSRKDLHVYKHLDWIRVEFYHV